MQVCSTVPAARIRLNVHNICVRGRLRDIYVCILMRNELFTMHIHSLSVLYVRLHVRMYVYVLHALQLHVRGCTRAFPLMYVCIARVHKPHLPTYCIFHMEDLTYAYVYIVHIDEPWPHVSACRWHVSTLQYHVTHATLRIAYPVLHCL
jgi:hypothetical protein